MSNPRFSREAYLEGEEPPEGLGPVEAILGVVPASVEPIDGVRDRQHTRDGRKKAGERRGERTKVQLLQPVQRRIKGIVETTTFVNSRLARLPLSDKRKVGPKEVLRPHTGLALLTEHEIAVASGRADAAVRKDLLKVSAEVDDLLAKKRGE